MIVYWDASAIVKLLLDEEGRHLAETIWAGDAGAAVSTLVRPEIASALARARRAGGLAPLAYEAALASSRRLLDEVDVIAVTDARAQRATGLVGDHGLLGADAVHLATALDLADLGADVVLATWDRRLHGAAVDSRLTVAPAEI